MLHVQERRLLYWLARNYYRGNGAIIDGGCLFGGSTLALGYGVEHNTVSFAGAPVHSYDFFVAESEHIVYAEAIKERFPEYFKKMAVGDSYREVFNRVTAPISQWVECHEGDIRAESWRGDEIEILFVDISKSQYTNDYLISEFFGSLIPGHSLVIHQDYFHEWCPWIHVSMEYLAAHFEPISIAKHGSLVFRCIAEIPQNKLSKRFGDFSPEERRDLMNAAVRRSADFARSLPQEPDDILYQLGILEVAKARLAFADFGKEAALDAIHACRALGSTPALDAAATLVGIIENSSAGAFGRFEEPAFQRSEEPPLARVRALQAALTRTWRKIRTTFRN
jgi:hypothetical protein